MTSPVFRVAPLVSALCCLLPLACSHDKSAKVGAPPGLPLVTGERLRVQSWTHGALSVPWRFYDPDFEQPCQIEAVGGEHLCVPYLQTGPQAGYADASCTTLAVAVADGGPAEGEVFAFSPDGLAILRVLRVGDTIDDGPLYYCPPEGEGFQISQDAPRRAAKPVDTAELVRFEERSTPLGDGLELQWYEGDDGSSAMGAIRRDGEPCWMVGNQCVLSSSLTYSFARAFTDAACTEGAFYIQQGCAPEGDVVVAMDECYGHAVLGSVGPSSTAQGYRRQPDGSCVEHADVGWFAECLQPVVPLEAGQTASLTEVRTSADGLDQVDLIGGEGLVVSSSFQLTALQAPCSPAWTADGVLRCVPLKAVMAATDPSGGGGSYVSVDICDEDWSGDYGEPLYTFFEGEPCSVQAVSVAGGEHGEPATVSEISTFEPYEGDVYEWGFTDDGYPECLVLPVGGWFVPTPVAADTFPEMTLAESAGR